MLRAQTGTVRVFGLDPVVHPVAVLSQLGYLSEQRDLPDWMTIRQLMRYTQAYYPDWDENYARELISTFNLDDSKQIKTLSKGMRAQVGLIAAVAYRPQLLVLDEPSSGLDALVREDILAAVVRAVSQDGRTVIFSSHFLDEVERMSDHITMINEGRVVFDGAFDLIGKSHSHTTVEFSSALSRPPDMPGALSVQGEGTTWHLVHSCPAEELAIEAGAVDARIVETRGATLMEIFGATASRGHPQNLNNAQNAVPKTLSERPTEP